ncbi:hypothetical protein L2E82_15402 [Cichorium intybus]|uniref:Uncharacterized protein n=1 Tax=Cichorium intybus TaxID=13427 RepID=A0ACB9F346_CICIN|nr:hypothetical protein L2E82_15402 [Cichorium intybus]
MVWKLHSIGLIVGGKMVSSLAVSMTVLRSEVGNPTKLVPFLTRSGRVVEPSTMTTLEADIRCQWNLGGDDSSEEEEEDHE